MLLNAPDLPLHLSSPWGFRVSRIGEMPVRSIFHLGACRPLSSSPLTGLGDSVDHGTPWFIDFELG